MQTLGKRDVTKRKSLPYDPSRADSGVLAGDLSYDDKYFTNEPDEDSAALVLETIIKELPDRHSCYITLDNGATSIDNVTKTQ
jgi:hypothetical protein